MVQNLKRSGTPQRVYYFEHGISDTIQYALNERIPFSEHIHRGDPHYQYKCRTALHRFLGHELYRVFPEGARMIVARKNGDWAEESRGPIASWRDFEIYDWPSTADADFSELDYLESELPENMRVIHVVDVWEVVRDLFGFETFCFLLYEDPKLIEVVFEKVGSFVLDIAQTLCSYRAFGALYVSDDLGYKTSLMIAPEDVRKWIFPWHKKLSDVAHQYGKFCLFHSCGNMYALMDEYIDFIGIDAKHSFEENVLPVMEVKRLYGSRVALLGGVDVDFLSRADESSIRKKTREILDTCLPGGGYFLGSGNWVTDYIPVDNYLAMLDEARKY